ncbi:MAG: hypothetical protein V8S30_02320 [Merdibacter sp.]
MILLAQIHKRKVEIIMPEVDLMIRKPFASLPKRPFGLMFCT